MTTDTRTSDTLTALLRGALLPTLGVGAVAVVVAGVLAGIAGVVGAVIGVTVVAAFFSGSILALRSVRHADPMIFLAVALLVFALKVLVLAVLLGVVARTGLPEQVIDRGALAGTVIATALAWIVAEILAFVRMRTPIYDLPDQAGRADGQGAA